MEQDKKNVDEEFSRAFTLIEQLSTDTAALKSAEEARTERLDGTLRDVENLVGDLKNASRRRDDETRRISDEVKTLKDAIPKALQGAREGNEFRLKELGTELKSLKTLLSNRLGGGAGSGPPIAGRTVSSTTNLPVASRPTEEPAAASPPATNGATTTPTNGQEQESSPAPTGQTNSSPLSQLGRSASIPAWQMAAANRSKKPSQSTPGSTDEGNTANTSTEQQQSAPAS